MNNGDLGQVVGPALVIKAAQQGIQLREKPCNVVWQQSHNSVKVLHPEVVAYRDTDVRDPKRVRSGLKIDFNKQQM